MIINFCVRATPTLMTVSGVIVADRFFDVQYFTWPVLGLTMIAALVAIPWTLFFEEAMVSVKTRE